MRALLQSFLLFLAATAPAAEYFVGPKGNDSWSGKFAEPNAGATDGPFATLAGAQDAVRKARAAGDASAVTVQVHGGTYEMPDGLIFGPEDSGKADALAEWRAFQNEKPMLIGGRAVKDWKPWKGDILQTDLAAQGFKAPFATQLIFADRRQPLARYPNFDPQNPLGGGWAYVDGEVSPIYTDKDGEDKHTLLMKAQDVRKWAHPEDVEVFIFPRYNWWNDILRVKSVDPATRTLTTEKDASYAMRANDRYYFQGALEELDVPGEWAVDHTAGTLWFRPPAPIASAPVYLPTTRDILRLNGAEYLTFRGFTLQCANGSGVILDKANHCRVIACTVLNVGDYFGTGVNVKEGASNSVIGCDIHDTGSNGISLSGGDRQTLTGAANTADNCYIHHVGIYYKQGVGVMVSGVGQRVSHCLIHDTPRFGIMFEGNSHLLEFNHLRHIALETEDVGGTYCGGRDWLSPRGSVMRYNFIHDVLGFGWNGKWTSPYFSWGIYLDDNAGGLDVLGNIVARCGRSLLHGHSARDCRIDNNIFIEGGERQWEFDGWTTRSSFWNQHLPTMLAGYQSVAGVPVWKQMRGMTISPQDAGDAEGRVMSGNVFTHNVIAWKNPASKALHVTAFDSKRNDFDRNLYWHAGLPLKTDLQATGQPIGGNLSPGVGKGPLGRIPTDWDWQVRPRADSVAILVKDGTEKVLRIDAGPDPQNPAKSPILTSRDLPLKPGGIYRLHARMRSDRDGTKAALMVQFYLPAKDAKPAVFWGSTPAEIKPTTAWQAYDLTVRIPAPGDYNWNDKMRLFKLRIDWPETQGSLFVDDLTLEEAKALDEWQSWQQLGCDRNSVIADPKFAAWDKDDYRLARDSPAWALGIKQIPVEKIGPFASPDRASWPIVEAEGAREKGPAH